MAKSSENYSKNLHDLVYQLSLHIFCNIRHVTHRKLKKKIGGKNKHLAAPKRQILVPKRQSLEPKRPMELDTKPAPNWRGAKVSEDQMKGHHSDHFT